MHVRTVSEDAAGGPGLGAALAVNHRRACNKDQPMGITHYL